MLRWLLLLTLSITLNLGGLYAQHIRITSSPKEIKTFLKDQNADKIVFNQDHKDVYQLRDKKTKKWGMFDWYDQLIPMEYDSIVPYKQFQPYTIAKNNGEYVIIQWPYDTDDLQVKQPDKFEAFCLKSIEENNAQKFFLLAAQNGQWGCINWQDLSTIIPFEYSSSDEVPLVVVSSKTSN